LCHRYGKCAEGTMTEEDVVLRENSNKKYGMKKYKSFPFPKSEEHVLMNQSGHQKNVLFVLNAISYVEGENKYYGTKVTINVWEPKMPHQKYLDSIEVGWQISRIYMVTN
ncbi:hypothetical protein HID58_052252, partial [Brassica napus]